MTPRTIATTTTLLTALLPSARRFPSKRNFRRSSTVIYYVKRERRGQRKRRSKEGVGGQRLHEPDGVGTHARYANTLWQVAERLMSNECDDVTMW